MPRSPVAYLADIVEAGAAIRSYLLDVDVDAYRSTRAVRAAVEREFILIGEAVASLARLQPELASRISHARRIVDFRNQLAQDYPAINDIVVWTIAVDEVPVLLEECQAILAELEPQGRAD